MSTILVIDDKQDNLLSISSLLKNLISDCMVLTAQSGPEGIEKANTESVDTILLDIHMPGMDGFEACKILKSDKATKHIPIIMLTAVRRETESLVKGLELGADAFFTKPIDESEFTAQVRAMLRIKKAEDQLRREKDLLAETVQVRTTQLNDSETKYQDLYDNAPDMFCSVDARTKKIVQCNQTLAHQTGYTKEEIIGRPILEMYHPDCMEEANKTFRSFLTTGEINNVDLQLRRKDGSKIEVCLNASSVRDKQGNILYSRSIWRDITERKQAEDALRESEMINRSLLEGTPVCNKIIDLDFKLQYMSSAGVELLKITDINSFYGQDYPPEFFCEETRIAITEKLRIAFTGKTSEIECITHDTEGNELWFVHTFVPVFDGDGRVKYLIGSSVNITDRKRAEKERIQLTIAIEQTDETVVITAKLGEIIYTNPAFERIFGYTAEESIGQNINFIKSSKHDESFYEQIWKTISKGQTWKGYLKNKKRTETCLIMPQQFRLLKILTVKSLDL